MTEGLITRIGRWIDNKWENKATESQLDRAFEDLRLLWKTNDEDFRAKYKSDQLAQDNLVKATQELVAREFDKVRKDVAMLGEEVNVLLQPGEKDKEVADLKTRLEKIELYSGMTRKVDPTKPPVVKTAFQM